MNNLPNLSRLYVHLQFLENCNLNVCFKPTLRIPPKPKVKERKEAAYSNFMFFLKGDTQDFHTKMITNLENMNIYEGLDPERHKVVKDRSIVRRNKRAVSNYSSIKRVQSAKNFDKTRMRLRSAS